VSLATEDLLKRIEFDKKSGYFINNFLLFVVIRGTRREDGNLW